MEHGHLMMAFLEWAGFFAPLLFITFHLLRPLFFLPVVLICVSGGILFGPIAGTLYSLIGITLSSIVFYLLTNKIPKTTEKFFQVKQKWLGKHTELTAGQITLLRLIPFIHFHLLSFCLLELTSGFKEYVKYSLLSNIPLAIVYTTFGGWVSNLSFIHVLLILLALLPLLYVLRRKEIILPWKEFFQVST